MKQLYLVRHAKSDWGHEGLMDIDRPLNERGYGDAYLMSKNFLKANEVPELLISSAATRALSTAMIFARTFAYPENEIDISTSIYEAPSSDIREVVMAIDEHYSRVMLFGHNPGLTNFFNEVSDSFLDNIPTCGVIGLQFSGSSWQDIFDKKAKTLFSDFPKEFKQ
jgi:phosphohistidine phosphatase